MGRKLGHLYPRLPCPRCGSGQVESRGRVGLEGVWPDVMLVRRYRCRRCGHTFVTYELADELPTGVSFSTEP